MRAFLTTIDPVNRKLPAMLPRNSARQVPITNPATKASTLPRSIALNLNWASSDSRLDAERRNEVVPAVYQKIVEHFYHVNSI